MDPAADLMSLPPALALGTFYEGVMQMAASKFGPVLKVSEDGMITFYDRERVWDI